MNTYFKVVNDQLVCIKQNHNEQVLFIIMDDQVPFQQRFHCSKCFPTHLSERMPINQAIATIKEKIVSKMTESRESSLQAVKEFCFKMNDLQGKFMKLFNDIYHISKLWIASLEDIQNDDLINIIKQFELFNLNNNKMNDFHNQAYFCKLDLIYQKLLDFKDFEDCFTILKQTIEQCKVGTIIKQEQQQYNPLQMQDQGENKKKSKICVSQVELVQNVQQDHTAKAIAFNYTGTIMVSGSEKIIKVWKFDGGKISGYKRLSGHTQVVNCLIFSKKLNWFVSGSSDQTIRCWKEQRANKWISIITKQQHNDDVLCLILNNNEDQLISCGRDSNIIVWQINCQNDILEYDYTLENKHTREVNCISLNDSESALVSCGCDKQIILWKKDNQDKWAYQHHISYDDFGMRICFIDNNQIAWQQKCKAITHIFQIENGQITPQYNVELKQDPYDDWGFPTIVNKQKEVIIQKHNKHVYILQKHEDGKLFIVCEPIDCSSISNFGTLTNDGEFLVLSGQQDFRVYNIKYQ